MAVTWSFSHPALASHLQPSIPQHLPSYSQTKPGFFAASQIPTNHPFKKILGITYFDQKTMMEEIVAPGGVSANLGVRGLWLALSNESCLVLAVLAPC